MPKVPVHGFIIICTQCGKKQIQVENRQDGTDFRCLYCGNKLLLRPGETFMMRVVKPKNKTSWQQDLQEIIKDVKKNKEDE